MSEAPDLYARLEQLERRVTLLETKHGELSPTVEEHDDRLDAHDMQLGKLALQMTQMVAEQHRLADELTKQSGALELILRNTASIAAALGVSK